MLFGGTLNLAQSIKPEKVIKLQTTKLQTCENDRNKETKHITSY